MTIGIYKIENLINHKKYIGQSIEIEKRWQKHLQAKDDFAIHVALCKYGKDNFSFQIIEECSEDKLDERECYWIKYYNSLVPNGYNMAEGGSNHIGRSKRKKVKQYSFDGIFIEEYNSIKEAAIAVGGQGSAITCCCKGKRNFAYGYQWKYSNSQKEIKPIIPSHYGNNYVILQIDKKTNQVIYKYDSLQEATAKSGYSKEAICSVLRHSKRHKSLGGCIWEYVKKEEKNKGDK